MNRKLVLALALTLLIGTLAVAFNVQKAKASGTIYIRADGSVEPLTAPISNLNNVIFTFTDNISDPIVIERDNIVVDGDGHAIQGIGTGTGIDLSYRSNVTLKNLVITQFDFGIYLNHSASCAIVGNIMMENNFEAIRLYESLNNNITSNDITATDYDGIVLYGSSDNKIDKNNLTDNYDGIRLYESSKNEIAENIVTSNYYGIFLVSSSDNSIFQNNVTTNDGNGVSLVWSSSENRIVENHIAANKWCGIYLKASSNNMIYHNSFVDNAQQISVNDSVNIWNEGYPSAGNYWSDYTGIDVYWGQGQDLPGSDGIGDAPCAIDENNRDCYPLMAPYSTFDAGNWNGTTYNADVVSNSTVSGFHFNPEEGTCLRFDVAGEEGTAGFCRVAIPKDLLWAEDGQWVVLVGDVPITNYTITSDENYAYLYFTYNHSTKTVQIQGTHAIPEFPSFLIVPLLMIATLVVAMVRRRKQSARH